MRLFRRKEANRLRECRTGSAVAARGLEDHGEDAGLVAGNDQGDMAIDGHLGLEQLLAGGIDVSGVGEDHGTAQLLLDDDAGGGVAEGAEVVGVHFDRAGPEEFLHAAADRGVEGSSEQCVGGIGDGLLLLLGVEALLAGRVAEGQERDDVGLGKRGIAAVGDGQFLGRSVQAERDVVILNVGRGAEVDDGFDADRICESDVAALKIVAGSGDRGAALGDGDAAQQRRRGQGAAQAQIHVAGQLGKGVLEVQLRRGDDVHVEADVV